MAVTLLNITSGASYTITALTKVETQANWRSSSTGTKVLFVPGADSGNDGYLLGVTDCQGTASDGPIVITPATGTIQGQPTAVIGSNFGSLVLLYDGTSNDIIVWSRT